MMMIRTVRICAGTIGGVGDNSEGVAGVNWQVSIM